MENNWTIQQTQLLFKLVAQAYEDGKGLKSAFEEMAKQSSKSINSVRNYYYSQLKMFQLVPSLAEDLGITVTQSGREQFELFTRDEIDNLVRTILVEKANGYSVRATIAKMSDSPKTALRLQNKYRSMVAHHKQTVTEIMNDLSAKGIKHFNPYTKDINDGTTRPAISKLSEYIAKLDESEVAGFLTLLGKLT